MSDKRYAVLVQFDSHEFMVRAKNKREAKSKVVEKLKKMPATKFALKGHLMFVDEA